MSAGSTAGSASMKVKRTLGAFALGAMLASCAGPAAVPTAALPTGSPFTANPVTATPAPPRPTSIPIGFVLPATCSYVGAPVVGSDSSQWKFDCGAMANRDARGTLAPAFQQQGWSSCGVGLGNATWKKFDFRLTVSEGSGAAAPDGLPTLTQVGSTVQTACG